MNQIKKNHSVQFRSILFTDNRQQSSEWVSLPSHAFLSTFLPIYLSASILNQSESHTTAFNLCLERYETSYYFTRSSNSASDYIAKTIDNIRLHATAFDYFSHTVTAILAIISLRRRYFPAKTSIHTIHTFFLLYFLVS